MTLSGGGRVIEPTLRRSCGHWQSDDETPFGCAQDKPHSKKKTKAADSREGAISALQRRGGARQPASWPRMARLPPAALARERAPAATRRRAPAFAPWTG